MCTCGCIHIHVCQGAGEVGWENHSMGGPSSDVGCRVGTAETPGSRTREE